MATISSSIRLMDNMTPAISSMMRGMNSMIAGFESMERASKSAIDTKSMTAAKAEMSRAAVAVNQFEKELKQATDQQERLNQSAKSGGNAMSGLAGKIGGTVAAYASLQAVQNVLNWSDEYSQTSARLNLINDGLQTSAELQEKIFASANQTRASYQSTAGAVAKLGTMAKDAFSSNDEMIGFVEQVNKQFVIAGASVSESENAMLQLTQAMASGVLRGDELNSIFENAPTIIQTVADYLEVPIGTIRDMASEGKITADTIKKAMFKSADATNKKFDSMEMTFGQVWTVFENKASKAFQGVFKDLSGLANSQELDGFLNAIADGISAISGMVSGVGAFFNIPEVKTLINDIGTNFGVASSSFKTNIDQIAEKIKERSPEMIASMDGAKTSWVIFYERLVADNEVLQGIDWQSGLVAAMDAEIEKVSALITLFTTMGTILTDVQKMKEAFWQGGDAFKEAAIQFDQDLIKMSENISKATENTPDPSLAVANAMETNRPIAQTEAEKTRVSIQEKFDPLGGYMTVIGQQTGDGVIKGLKDREGAIASGGDAAATALKASFKSALGINSPSTVFRDFGYYAIDGLIQGLSSTELMTFCESIVADMQAAFKAGNFNLQAGIEFLGSGAEEFFKSIGIGVVAQIGDMLWPTASQDITSGFGWRTHPITGEQKFHEGIDIAGAFGDAVNAAAAGTVFQAGWNGGYGNCVQIDHGNGLTTLYGHLSAIDVAVGQIVSAGQKIGEIGSTGDSTGPHLHYGVYQDGTAIDPMTAKVVGATGDGSAAANWIQQALKTVGINASQAEFNHLMQLAWNESNYNPNAINDWDSNAMAGTPSMGFMQTIQSTFDAYSLGGSIWDPVANAVAAIRYMIDKYGSILNTPLGGYANGTTFATPGLHLVGEHGPEIVNMAGGEKVLNAKKTQGILNNAGKKTASSGKAIAPIFHINIKNDNTINSELDIKKVSKALAAELEEEIQLKAAGMY